MQNLEQQVRQLIQQRDKSCPISGGEIATILGLDGSQAVRRIVHYLRTQLRYGEILANGSGYFWSNDPKDWFEYAEKLHKRWVQIYEVEKAVRRRLQVGVTQEILFEEMAR
jgi:hypothetical protein